MEKIGVKSYSRARHQLFFTFFADDYSFTNSLWYEHVDFLVLEERFGKEQMEYIYFHIALYELNKLGSLKPEYIELGPFQKYYSTAFEDLWREIFVKVWAQWRYENNYPDYEGPAFSDKPRKEYTAQPLNNQLGDIPMLSFCGGGKDSLVALHLLDEIGERFSTFSYSNSIYGNASFQHDLISSLADHANSNKHHRMWVFDDFLESPLLELDENIPVKSYTAAETPSSIFEVLPVMLAFGYQYIVLAHEKSADVGNLIWDQTGEDVNHQWGKSYEAELLLNNYLAKHLISNCSYFSILKPINDVFIFNILRHQNKLVEYTHSCNIKKPWCFECPKCAYVLLNYWAYLDEETVNKVVGENNIFSNSKNEFTFRQLLGMEEHTPFECVGQIEETRLAFELCRVAGVKGKAIEEYEKHASSLTTDFRPIIEKFTQIYEEESIIPDVIQEKLIPVLKKYQQEARNYIIRKLNNG